MRSRRESKPPPVGSYRASTSGSGSSFQALVYQATSVDPPDSRCVATSTGFRSRGEASGWARRTIRDLLAGTATADS